MAVLLLAALALIHRSLSNTPSKADFLYPAASLLRCEKLEAHLTSTDSSASALKFDASPASWYFIATAAQIERGPVRFELPDGAAYVAFRVPGKGLAVLNARCSHMGANLARGCVKNGRIACPLHGWEYAPDGRCEHIPGFEKIPAFARQQTFPVVERAGLVFFFNRSEARFPLPFFDGVAPDDLHPAEEFDLWDDVPWYLLAGNGFDRQHFQSTHSRRIVDEPVVRTPHPFAMQSILNLEIGGDSPWDRLTRMLAGNRSTMTVTSWCGSLIFATARFRKTTTYGMISVRPLANLSTHAKVIVFVPRSKGWLGRTFIDPLHARIRRKFIRAFFEDDLGRLTGTRFCRERMIDADKMLVDYLDWLHKVHR